jgi:hypothetical protein
MRAFRFDSPDLLKLDALILVLSGGRVAVGQSVGWTREIKVPAAKILLYQPQVDSLEKNHLMGRSAVSVTPAGKTEPVFGTIWYGTKLVWKPIGTHVWPAFSNSRYPKFDFPTQRRFPLSTNGDTAVISKGQPCLPVSIQNSEIRGPPTQSSMARMMLSGWASSGMQADSKEEET